MSVLAVLLHSVFFWPLFYLGTVVLVWFALIRPALKSYHFTAGVLDELDSATRPFWARVMLELKGMWTAVIAAVSGFFTMTPDLLDKMTGIHWEAFFDPATATKIVAGISLVLTVLHVWEMKAAAAIVPKQAPVSAPNGN